MKRKTIGLFIASIAMLSMACSLFSTDPPESEEEVLTTAEMLLSIPTLKSLLPSTMLVTEAELDPASVAAKTVAIESQNPVVLGQQYLGLNHAIESLENFSFRDLIDLLAARTDLVPGETIILGSMSTPGGDLDAGKVRVESKVRGEVEIFWTGPVIQMGPFMPLTQMFVYIVLTGSNKSAVNMKEVITLRKVDENGVVDLTVESGRISSLYSPDGTIKGTQFMDMVTDSGPYPMYGYVEVKKRPNGKTYLVGFDQYVGLSNLGYADESDCVVRYVDPEQTADEYYEDRKFKYIDYKNVDPEAEGEGYGTDFVTTNQILHAQLDELNTDSDVYPKYWYSANSGTNAFDGSTDTQLISWDFDDDNYGTTNNWVHYLPATGLDTTKFTVPDMTADKLELDELALSLASTIDVSTVAKYQAMADAVCTLPDLSLFP
ncbi:MAG TPA: hypothetical protein DIC34_00035 [Treponema sp.]|nr:MAG: hypothetical protein A2001_18485 [Treponema sp. GWC1_61_84]HCM24937.1 hypothetical protein [Treponema sp.]